MAYCGVDNARFSIQAMVSEIHMRACFHVRRWICGFVQFESRRGALSRHPTYPSGLEDVNIILYRPNVQELQDAWIERDPSPPSNKFPWGLLMNGGYSSGRYSGQCCGYVVRQVVCNETPWTIDCAGVLISISNASLGPEWEVWFYR